MSRGCCSNVWREVWPATSEIEESARSDRAVPGAAVAIRVGSDPAARSRRRRGRDAGLCHGSLCTGGEPDALSVTRDLRRRAGANLDWWRAGERTSLRSTGRRRRLPGLVAAEAGGSGPGGPLRGDKRTPACLVVLASPTGRALPERARALGSRPARAASRWRCENDHRLRELSLRFARPPKPTSVRCCARLGRHDITDSIVGAETGLKEVMEQIELVARSDTPVLILGETGSGKEVVARAIHSARGGRRAVPAGQLRRDPARPGRLGAVRPRAGKLHGGVARDAKGWFERADGGTLFLDECGELPCRRRSGCCASCRTAHFERVGGERPLHVDVRIVAATHRDLPAMVAAGSFREDLWYRLAVFPIRLPPLRERVDDIPALAAHFAQRAAKRLGLAPIYPRRRTSELLWLIPGRATCASCRP